MGKLAESRGVGEGSLCHRLTYLVDAGLIESSYRQKSAVGSFNCVPGLLLRYKIRITHRLRLVSISKQNEGGPNELLAKELLCSGFCSEGRIR